MALLQVRNFPDEQEQRKTHRQELLKALLDEPPEIPGDFPAPADLIREDRE